MLIKGINVQARQLARETYKELINCQIDTSEADNERECLTEEKEKTDSDIVRFNKKSLEIV